MNNRLQEAIDKANEICFKLNKFKLKSKRTDCLQVFEPISNKTSITFVFKKEKIKTHFELNKKKYVIDIFKKQKYNVLAGRMEKDEYFIDELPFENLEKYLKENILREGIQNV